MKISRVEINNFMAFGEGNEISLKDRGLLLIEGENLAAGSASSNGAGKTSLIDSLTFSLFGETTKGVLADDVVNQNAGKDCLVSVTVEDLSGSLRKIVRTRKHTLFNNSLRFLLVDDNGALIEDLSGVDIAATQERINGFLGMTYQVFMNSAYFAQESLKPFCELTDKQIKEVFMKTMSLERFMSSLESVRADINLEQKELEKRESALVMVDSNVSSANGRLSELSEKNTAFAQEHLASIAVINESLEDCEIRMNVISVNEKSLETVLNRQGELNALATIYSAIAKNNDETASIHNRIEEYEQKHDGFEAGVKADMYQMQLDVAAQQKRLTTIQGREDELNKNIQQIESLRVQLEGLPEVTQSLSALQAQMTEYITIRAQLEYQVEQYKGNLEEAARASDTVKSKVGKPCPECGRTIEESCFESILAANDNKIRGCESQIADIQGMLVASKSVLESMSRQMDGLNQKTSSYSDISGQVARLEGSVSSLRKEVAEKQVVLAQIQSIKQRITDKSEEISPFLAMIEQEKGSLSLLVAQYNELTSSLHKALVEVKYLRDDEKESTVEVVRLIPEVMKEAVDLQAAVSLKPGILARIDGLLGQLATKEKEASPYLPMIEQETAEISLLSETRGKIEANRSLSQEKIDYLRFLEVAFGYQGLPSFLLDAVTPYLNERAGHYAAIVCDGEIRIEFSTTKRGKRGSVKDQFQINVSHIHGADRYKGISGGEKRRADLCISQAMQDLVSSFGSNPLDFRAYDEPFSAGLDPEGVEGVLNLLDEIAVSGKTVLVVSHLPEIKGICKNQILVSKDKTGVSRIVE